MALTMPQASGGDFELCPSGNYVATCYRVIDLGTQEVTYEGDTKHQRKIYIGWEMPTERMETAECFVIGKRYTYSSHEKSTLRKHLESWRNKRFVDSDFGPGGFHIRKLIGVSCMLQIVHTERDGKTYANVEAVTNMPKGVTPPERENDSLFFSLEPDEFDIRSFEKLSDGLKDVIAKSPEYALLMQKSEKVIVPNGSSGHDEPDDIPF